MKKSEIIIIITIVILAVSAIVVGIFAFKGSEEKISSGGDEIKEFFSELFEKKEEEPDTDPVVPATTNEPDETEEPEDDDDDVYEEPDYDIFEDNEFFEYDERGNIIRENYGDYYIINQYDENNLKVWSLTHNSDDRVIKTTGYIYDENGNLIRRNNFNETGARTDYIEYEYSDDGSHIESGYLSNGILMDKTWFDESGFMVRSEYYYKGDLTYLYEFDPETFCGKQTNFDEDGNIIYYAEYDENGDIVKEEIYE